MDSLVNQTLKNIEIIIVNDASPDKSEEIIQEYAAKDERIVYIKHEENKCLGGARNTGMRAAKGKYITFVDSDDYVDRDLYGAAVNALQKYNLDVVTVPFRIFGNNCNRCFYIKSLDKIFSVQVDTMQHRTYFAAWSKVYRRQDLIENEVYFPEHMYWEDMVFWAEVCAVLAPKVMNIPPNLGGYYCYRQRKNSITGQSNKHNQTLPKSYFCIYQMLIKRKKISEYKLFFYQFLSDRICSDWFSLADAYKTTYLQYLSELLQVLSFNEKEQRQFFQLYLLSKLKTDQDRALIIETYKDYTNIKTDLWYCFGQLSIKKKIIKICKIIVKPFVKMIGLWPYIQRMRRRVY